jgi:hypothetical protein
MVSAMGGNHCEDSPSPIMCVCGGGGLKKGVRGSLERGEKIVHT